MKRFNVIKSLICILLLVPGLVMAKVGEVKILTEYDYYTQEDSASIMVYLPSDNGSRPYFLSIDYMGDTLVSAQLTPGLSAFSIPISHWVEGKHLMHVCLVGPGQDTLNNGLVLNKLPHKYNAVKINRATGGLFVDGLPFYPFGFYCYSPVQPTLPEEEVIRGFNMMSPYQKIEGKTLNDRKIYMDRCARLGMKVHYNLLSVSGGGGVGSGRLDGLGEEEKRMRLVNEINTFKDHPALLAWYISDEPVGQKVPPEPLVEMYHTIKELDPYHPVSIVFMTPGRAREYEQAMDIVMADPYPIPMSPVTLAGRVTDDLSKEFYLEKPVWIVPQAFGGGEWWQREPTASEMRVMTYLAMVEGAQGIQYFIRHGRNAFPKSVVAWNEASNMAHEVAELTPVLTRGTVVEGVQSSDRSIRVRCLKYQDQLILLVVNAQNLPRQFTLKYAGFKTFDNAEVMFENRESTVVNGTITGQIEPFGTRVYRLRKFTVLDTISPFHDFNMVFNPGFEEVVSPLIPTGTYARLGRDRGATFFVDSRLAVEGSHALRLVTPKAGEGTGLSFFPVQLRNGYSYTIEVWARAKPVDPDWEPYEPSWFKRLLKKWFGWLKKQEEKEPIKFEMNLGTLGSNVFTLSDSWQKYEYSLYVDALSSGMQRVNPQIELISEGTAWFDQLQVYPDMNITSIARDGMVEVGLQNLHDNGVLRYTLDSTDPTYQSTEYLQALHLDRSVYVTAAVFKGDSAIGKIFKEVVVHDGIGAKISFVHRQSPRYAGIGPESLMDGTLASLFFRDEAWLGFEDDDFIATIEWADDIRLDSLEFSFLEDPRVDIFLPADVMVEISKDGSNFIPVFKETDIQPGDGTIRKRQFHISLGSELAKSLRLTARNSGEWMFVDEIVVNKR